MMSTAHEEEAMVREALLLTRDSLLQSVEAVKDSASTASNDIQTEILAFHALLISIDSSEENVRILNLLRHHKKALEGLRDCLRDYDGRKMDSETGPKNPEEEQKSFLLQQRHIILNCWNELSLVLATRDE